MWLKEGFANNTIFERELYHKKYSNEFELS